MNPKASKNTQALPPQQNEHLILLEFFVERVVFNSSLDPKLKNCKTIVDFQFMDNEPILLDSSNEKNSEVELCGKESINMGNTCLFSLTPEEATAISTLFDIYVRAYKVPKCGKPQNILVGIALIPLTDQCNKILKKAGDKKLDSSPGASEFLKNSFPLHGLENNQPIGHICVSVRINCFGKYIQTDFQLNMEDTSIDYKANEAQYRLKYHKKFVPCPEKCPQPKSVPCADPAICGVSKSARTSTDCPKKCCNRSTAATLTCPGQCGNQTTSAALPLDASTGIDAKASNTKEPKPAKGEKQDKKKGKNDKKDKKGKGDKKKVAEESKPPPPLPVEKVCPKQCRYSPNYQLPLCCPLPSPCYPPPPPPPPPCCPPPSPPPCCPPPSPPPCCPPPSPPPCCLPPSPPPCCPPLSPPPCCPPPSLPQLPPPCYPPPPPPPCCPPDCAQDCMCNPYDPNFNKTSNQHPSCSPECCPDPVVPVHPSPEQMRIPPLPCCQLCCYPLSPPPPEPNICPSCCANMATTPQPIQQPCNCKSEAPVTMMYASEPNYNPNPPTNNFQMDMGLGGSLCCRIHEEQVPNNVPCPVNYMPPPTTSGKCPFPCSQNGGSNNSAGCPPCMRPKRATVVEMGPGPANQCPFRFSVGDGAIDQNQLCVSPPTYTALDGTNYTEISDPNKQVFLMRIGKKFDGVLGGKNNVDLHLTTPPPPLADAELENRGQQYNIGDTPPGATYVLGSQAQNNAQAGDKPAKKSEKSTQKAKGGKKKKK